MLFDEETPGCPVCKQSGCNDYLIGMSLIAPVSLKDANRPVGPVLTKPPNPDPPVEVTVRNFIVASEPEKVGMSLREMADREN